MPPFGPPRTNPFEPAPPKRRAPAWLTAGLLPALVGGLVVLGGIAATGNLGGGTVVRSGDATPLPAATPSQAAADAEGLAAARTPGSVQAVVARTSPAVVKVTVGNATSGGRLGSGFLVDRRGRVLTNAHVVGNAHSASVTFEDGTVSTAKVLGADESTDLAVLQVARFPGGVRPLQLGRSGDLVVGDPVIAIGNPLGLEHTATTGIVSALKRLITAPNGFQIQNVVQTDAAINEGNSGGPLLDHAGQVVGINSQIATETGGNIGIGFAVPSDTIRPVADSIIATGHAQHAWLGMTGRSVTPDIAKSLGVGAVRGVAIVQVDPRGPAAKAGLRPATNGTSGVPRGADLIVAVDGRPVQDMADVSRAVSSRAVGDRIALSILRNGAHQAVPLTLADRPADVGVRAGGP